MRQHRWLVWVVGIVGAVLALLPGCGVLISLAIIYDDLTGAEAYEGSASGQVMLMTCTVPVMLIGLGLVAWALWPRLRAGGERLATLVSDAGQGKRPALGRMAVLTIAWLVVGSCCASRFPAVLAIPGVSTWLGWLACFAPLVLLWLVVGGIWMTTGRGRQAIGDLGEWVEKRRWGDLERQVTDFYWAATFFAPPGDPDREQVADNQMLAQSYLSETARTNPAVREVLARLRPGEEAAYRQTLTEPSIVVQRAEGQQARILFDGTLKREGPEPGSVVFCHRLALRQSGDRWYVEEIEVLGQS